MRKRRKILKGIFLNLEACKNAWGSAVTDFSKVVTKIEHSKNALGNAGDWVLFTKLISEG
jgi:hypothetical protein